MSQKYASINPTIPNPESPSGFSNGFAALVNVKSSRYAKHEYNPESGIAAKVGIKWTMGTTKGNTFERTWSTGVPWEDGIVSDDGKRFSGQIKNNSDAMYMLKKAVSAGFPAEKLSDDVSVFENETFFMTDDVNPNAKGSKKKSFPKKYHPEGWDQALADTLARRAAREAQANAPAYQSSETTFQSSYTPPPVVAQSNDVIQTAGAALTAILGANGGTITRSKIPSALNVYVEQDQKNRKTIWEKDFRQSVAVALWDMEQLKTIVSNDPKLRIDNETIYYV